MTNKNKEAMEKALHALMTGLSVSPAINALEKALASESAAVPVDMVHQMERADWTPKEALEFYAAGKHYDIPDGRMRILDTGAIASNALKSIDLEYATKHGDVSLLEPVSTRPLTDNELETIWLNTMLVIPFARAVLAAAHNITPTKEV